VKEILKKNKNSIPQIIIIFNIKQFYIP